MMETIKRCLSLGLPMSAIFSRQRRSSLGQDANTLRTTADSPAPVVVAPIDSSSEVAELVSVSGTVVRDGGRFALRISGETLYALDSTGRAWPFEGEDVVVLGLLNQKSGVLHIRAIQATDGIQAEAV